MARISDLFIAATFRIATELIIIGFVILDRLPEKIRRPIYDRITQYNKTIEIPPELDWREMAKIEPLENNV